MPDSPQEQVISNPTYMGNIRYFFEPEDIDHMGQKGFDFSTYAGVKKHALAIFAHTSPPNADMPPEPERKWTAERSQTFKNWILTGYPVGTPPTDQPAKGLAEARTASRVRKNAASLGDPEIQNLKTAFQGLMNKDPTDPNSYYSIASVHGLPQSFCLHHEDRYNPWHRTYLRIFEDALRSVPGCADVTLPYWDIQKPIPALLKAAPFDSYVVPVDLGPGYGQNYQTSRNDQARIDANLTRFSVFADLDTALKQGQWGAFNTSGFQQSSINAHDGGHLSVGPTMADQNVASFDPIFWFYHCNLDRHWLSWQTSVSALTLAGFKSTLSGSADWLSPPFNELQPYSTTADQTITFDIGYDQLMARPTLMAFENKVGSLEAMRTFTIPAAPEVSVMVKDINRLEIPGSFVVSLLADGQPIAERAFFQPKQPKECATCRKIGLINLAFRVPQDQVAGRKLSVQIEVPEHEALGKKFPLSAVGNPTINARLLLQEAP